MRKFFLILILIYANMDGLSQRYVATLNIDSLKAELLIAKDTTRINTLNLLARRIMFNTGTLPDSTTIQYIEEALALSKKINYPKGIGNALLNKGIEASSNHHYNKALPFLREALPLLIAGGDIYAMISTYSFTGQAFQSLGDNKTALSYFDTTRKLSLELNDSSTATWQLVHIMHSYHDLGNYDEAYKKGQQALSEVTKDDMLLRFDDIILRSWILTNLANLFLAAGLPENAIDYVDKIRKFYPGATRQSKLPWPLPMALRIGGDAFLQMNKLDSALAIEKLIHIPLNDQDARDNLFYGRLYVAQKQYEKALPYFTRGFSTASANQYKIQMAQNATELGNTYFLLNDDKKALHYAHLALQIGTSIQALHEIKGSAATLARIYEKKKIYSKAYYYDQLYKSTSNSLATEEYKRKLALVQIQTELDKRLQDASLLLKENLIAKQEVKIKQKEIEKVSILKNILIASLGVFLILGLIVFRIIALKQKITLLEMRSRVSQDLHDEIGASISGINLLTQVATEKLQNNKPAEASEFLIKIKSYSQDVIEKLSDMEWLFNPQNDSIEKLLQRLKYFAISIASSKDATIHFSTGKEAEIINLSISQRKAIYLVSKEAINNAVKYAGCMNIYFNLTPQGQGWKLQISDDGKGFLLAENENGNGLKNMYARADEIGAKFKIQTNPLTGTNITMEL